MLIRIEGTSQKSSLAVSNRPGAIAPNPERPRGAGRGGDNAAPAAPRSLFPPVSRREALREGWAGPGRAAPLAGGRRISLPRCAPGRRASPTQRGVSVAARIPLLSLLVKCPVLYFSSIRKAVFWFEFLPPGCCSPAPQRHKMAPWLFPQVSMSAQSFPMCAAAQVSLITKPPQRPKLEQQLLVMVWEYTEPTSAVWKILRWGGLEFFCSNLCTEIGI